jgi:hypothetical protein
MLTIQHKPGRLCDGPSRRELLTIGGLSLIGLHLPEFLYQRARAQTTGRKRGGFGAAQSVLLIHLQGSPSHIDLWDPKPNAPDGIRGEFKPIATRVPGMFLGEVLPLLAQQANQFTLIRSIGVKPRGLANHGAAIYMLMTGHDPLNFSPTGLAVPPSRDDLPSVGAVVARFRPAGAKALNYVALCSPVIEANVAGVGMFAGILGAVNDPYQMYDDPTQPIRNKALTLPADMTLGRLQARLDVRSAIGAQQTIGPADFDRFYGKALGLLSSAEAARAFRLDEEAPVLRDRYGQTRFGQSLLLARRVIEAGTRFVQVTWPAGSDTEPAEGPDGSWDTHRNNFPMLKKWRCPVFDRAMSALLEDLNVRGLLDSTLVLAIGEFGRSPKIGSPTTDNVGPGGRDHWPSCYTCLIAGGGIQPGQVYGESDANGAHPKTSPVHPYDVISTIYHAIGIEPTTTYLDKLSRPRGLVDHGNPILGLF